MSLPITTKEVPFFKLIVPLLVGIALQYFFEILDNILLNYVVALLLLITAFVSFQENKSQEPSAASTPSLNPADPMDLTGFYSQKLNWSNNKLSKKLHLRPVSST